jgi:DNA-binding IclR family transcriptional regulator
MSLQAQTTSSANHKPGKSKANRSLERGVEVIRAFRPGASVLGNGEIAERTGLSRSTVTRLTQTLVGCGLLQPEPGTRAYRLAPALLSFAHAMRSGSQILALVAPLMREVSEKHKVNVGLATSDGDEMLYLESIRYNRRPSHRTVVSGQRVPMALTSLGRAYLAVAPEAHRKQLLTHFKALRKGPWETLAREIDQARDAVMTQGYCHASWQPEVLALACPLVYGESIYVINVSVSSSAPLDTLIDELAPVLTSLKRQVMSVLQTGPNRYRIDSD